MRLNRWIRSFYIPVNFRILFSFSISLSMSFSLFYCWNDRISLTSPLFKWIALHFCFRTMNFRNFFLVTFVRLFFCLRKDKTNWLEFAQIIFCFFSRCKFIGQISHSHLRNFVAVAVNFFSSRYVLASSDLYENN